MLLGCIGALQEIISENGSFRCWEFSCSTSMPKWRTVSFVPGVTLNIGDSTSLRWSQIIFFVNNIVCNMKKRFSNLSGHSTVTYYHLEAVFLGSDKCAWKIEWTIYIIYPIATYCYLNLGPNKFWTLLWSSGVRQTRPQFLSELSIVTNWTCEQLTPRQKYHNISIFKIIYVQQMAFLTSWHFRQNLDWIFKTMNI